MTNHKDTINTKSYTLDPGIIGADFPILSTKINGKPLRYLDSAASAQKPTAVINRMTQFYLHEYANVHRGIHHLSDIATNSYEDGRLLIDNVQHTNIYINIDHLHLPLSRIC